MRTKGPSPLRFGGSWYLKAHCSSGASPQRAVKSAALRNAAQVDPTVLPRQTHLASLGIVNAGTERNHRSVLPMGGDQDGLPAYGLEADHHD